jgi:predicted O-methyltransferase YrrM
MLNKHRQYEDRFSNEANIVNYYAIIREIEPNIVAETGTATGSMTSWVLAALEANENGQLISIDIPPVQGKLAMDLTINKDEIGFLIPREYHHRLEYICGDAKVMLPRVLADNPADVFIHDSLHTRTHMLFEYNVARCLMRPNTVILSDDILWNGAFFSFLKSHHLTGLGCISNPNLGLTVNAFDEYELKVGTDIIRKCT